MEDKVCLVTGASAGSMGAGICRSLAEAGFRNLALVARTREKLEATAAACREAGTGEVLVVTKDLSEKGACAQVVKETLDKFGSTYAGTVQMC